MAAQSLLRVVGTWKLSVSDNSYNVNIFISLIASIGFLSAWFGTTVHFCSGRDAYIILGMDLDPRGSTKDLIVNRRYLDPNRVTYEVCRPPCAEASH